MSTPVQPTPEGDRSFYIANAILCAVALGVLAWILLLRRPGGDPSQLAFMPAINATMNSLSASFLVAGFLAIKRKRVALHRGLMLSAFGASSLFLAGYLVYHYVHGDTRYPVGAPLRGFYLALLASHVLLSIVALPLVLTTFWFALKGRTQTHRKVAKVTLPLWLYVSVTGVLVFFMLRFALSSVT